MHFFLCVNELKLQPLVCGDKNSQGTDLFKL